MSGPIEHSVTLEDVFAVVNAKRVPLAPELAGYLTLEIAEGAQTHAGDVEPRSVYIGEEGTVALVRSRDGAGDTEASVRAILQRLLESSGSATPALGAASRRKSGGGLPALIEELEAALIPVNRAAGRRALARLAREVKRVTAGVGRNAPPPERPAAAPPRPTSPQGATRLAPPAPRPPPAAVPVAAAVAVVDEPEPSSGDAFPDLAEALPRGPSAAPPEPPPAETPPPAVPIEVDAAVRHPTQPSGADAVDQLLASFEVSGATTDRAVSRELKAMVGLEPTPPPPSRQQMGPVISAMPGPDDVEVLLAMTDQSIPIANVRRPQTPVGLAPPPATMVQPPVAPGLAPTIKPLVEPPPMRAATPPAGRQMTPPQMQPPPQMQQIQPQMQPPPQMQQMQPPPQMQQMQPPPQMQQMQPPPQMPPRPSMRPAPPARSSVPDGSGLPPMSSSGRPATQGMAPRQGSRHAKTMVLPRELGRKRARRINTVLALLTLIVLAGGAVALWMLKPGFFTGRTPDKLEQEKKAAALASQQALAQQQVVKCRGALTIADVPVAAEVLLRLGQAPVDIDRMPVGARLEFVATAEGFAPKRSIVPAGAAWDPGADGKPRFELAVQLEPSRARPGAIDPWPAGQPGTVVGGKGAPGTVHVVSTPRAAEMWLLVGAGPEATIDPIKCDQDTEILVAGPTTFRKRLKVTAADVARAPLGQTGAHAVRMSAK